MCIRSIILITIGVTIFFPQMETAICYAQTSSNLDYKPGELVVRFAPKRDGMQRTRVQRNALLTSIDGGYIKHSYKIVPGLTVVKLPESVAVKDALEVFNNTDGISYAVPNYRAKALLTIPDDSRFDELWGMHNTAQTGGIVDADIDAPQAWDIATDANDIIVAVIDTGVDYTHPDLAGNMWVNEAELNGTPGIDDDENDYVDDVYGWFLFDFTRSKMVEL